MIMKNNNKKRKITKGVNMVRVSLPIEFATVCGGRKWTSLIVNIFYNSMSRSVD
jgi:hypothetical protein